MFELRKQYLNKIYGDAISKLKIEKNELFVEEGDNSLVAKLIAECSGKISIDPPLIKRKINKVTKVKKVK